MAEIKPTDLTACEIVALRSARHPGRGLWRADSCRVGLERRGSGICTLGWLAVPSRGGGAFGGVRPPATPRRGAHRGQTVADSHTPGLSATSARNETGRVVPRYYNATHIWASDNHHWTLLPNPRRSAVNGNTRWGTPAPRPATRSPGAGPIALLRHERHRSRGE
jgi:hypothetical protein